jgi:DNA-binding winged helix-turn-helix (wHTH) protein
MIDKPPNEPRFAFGPFRLFPTHQLLLEGETPVRIGDRARDLLVALLEQPGQAVSKQALSARAWPSAFVEDVTLRAQVAALRKALRDGQDGRRYIANVPGRGYAFVGEMSTAVAQPPVSLEPPQSAPVLSTVQLFGRAEAIETLTNRLAENRLVTVVGPGGIGKTAVALAVADRMRPGLRDGVCFVDLAPLADARLVSTAIASALGLSVLSEDPLPSLIALLRDRDTLIVLDNCEHVVESAALLAETIARSTEARLRILATSREALRVQGERVFRLAPLELPRADEHLTATIAMAYPAVQLFVERAAMCLGEYSLTDADAPGVANICRHLDGIALAIEIAAGQVFPLASLDWRACSTIASGWPCKAGAPHCRGSGPCTPRWIGATSSCRTMNVPRCAGSRSSRGCSLSRRQQASLPRMVLRLLWPRASLTSSPNH